MRWITLTLESFDSRPLLRLERIRIEKLKVCWLSRHPASTDSEGENEREKHLAAFTTTSGYDARGRKLRKSGDLTERRAVVNGQGCP